MKKNLPTLFKKSSTGAILEWRIRVEGTTIVTMHGQVGGKIQTTKDTVKTGKNAGRKNETGAAEQALKEAESKWTKQKKAGYVESIGAAEAGATDALIEGGVLPMLAKVYEDEVAKISYPVAVQPKLDGHRCIAMIETVKGKEPTVTLWTRTRKRITSVPHIELRLKTMAMKLKWGNYVLDGELYNHDLREDFEKITSAARKKQAGAEAETIQYHVYDMIAAECFKSRFGRLGDIILAGGREVELVNTKYANTADEAAMYFTLFQKLGYEGSMVRMLGIPYENKRSHQLLKVKVFNDEEFEIVDVEEGRGKLMGCGIFVCKKTDGATFNVKMAEENEGLRKYWEKKSEYVGKMLTVKFQGKTKDGIPRFPVGLRLREDL